MTGPTQKDDGPGPFPGKPCELCTGNSACWVGKGEERRLQTSAEWCAEMGTCAATIDWDKVYGHDS